MKHEIVREVNYVLLRAYLERSKIMPEEEAVSGAIGVAEKRFPGLITPGAIEILRDFGPNINPSEHYGRRVLIGDVDIEQDTRPDHIADDGRLGSIITTRHL